MIIAVVGATGLVGRKTLEVLEQKNIKAEYILFASKNSKGEKIDFFEKQYKVKQLSCDQIEKNPVDYVLFCASARVAKKYVHKFIENGATVTISYDCAGGDLSTNNTKSVKTKNTAYR